MTGVQTCALPISGLTAAVTTGYTITATGSNGTSATCTWTSGTTCTFTGLSGNVTYTYSIVETNANGSSAAATGTFTTAVGAPGAPTITSVTATDTTATLTWTAPTSTGGAPIGSYLVSVTAGATATCTTTTALTCTVTGLTAGTASGSYSVTAYNAAGIGTPASSLNGAVTAGTIATLAAAGAPAAPTIITTGALKPSYPAFGSVTFNFYAGTANATPVTGFICQAVDPNAVNATVSVSVGATATTCTLSGLANASYNVSVVALNATLNTAATGTASGTFASNTWVNDAPALFGGASAVSGTVSIQGLAPLKDLANGGLAVGSTTDNLDPTSYIVNASLSAGGAVAGTKTCTTLATPCTVTGLVAGTKYYVSVLTVNAAGTSNVYQTSAFTVLAATAPAAPTNVAATRNATGLAITWTAPASVGSGQLVGYWVTATDPLTTQQYSCPYNATYGLLLAPATSCSIAGLSVGSTYNISITAISQDGAGTKQLSAAGTKTGVLYNVLAPEPVMATFLAVTTKQKSVSALSPAAKTALSGLISSTNDGAQITIAGYGTTKAIALARANAAANYLFNNGAAVHVTIKSVISKTIKTALVTVTSN